jgi:hypothetical protein
VLVPIYLLHRYQVEAASKLVGGMDYTFALRGDGEVPTQIVAAAEQRRALTAVLATVKPEVLALPEALLKIIPPRPPDYERGREHFKIHTSPAFDALAPAEAAAQQSLQFLFDPQRAARLVEFHARNSDSPGLEEVLDAVLNASWKSSHGTGYEEQIAFVVDDIALHDLMTLCANDQAPEEVRAIANHKLTQLETWIGEHVSSGPQRTPSSAQEPDTLEISHRLYAVKQIEAFEKDPKNITPAPPPPPDGSPIGAPFAADED